jgi:cell division protein ZapA
MAEVNIDINGRKYRMACEDGQEQHLQNLAARFNEHVGSFRGDFGEIGDNRLTVMAGIAITDTLVDAEKRIEALQAELAEITSAGQKLAEENEALERQFADHLSETARKIELAAGIVEAVNQEMRTGS